MIIDKSLNLINSLVADNSIVGVFDQRYLELNSAQREVQSNQTIAFIIIYKRGGFMSTKQFISAEEQLAKRGVSIQQAADFITINIDQPEVIFAAARESGVTNAMLNEITNFPTEVITEYFTFNDLDPRELDNTSILFNSDPDSLENLVNFNNNIEVLSNSSLSEQVQSLLSFDGIYPLFLGPIYTLQSDDKIYDTEELGVGHLNNVPATEESVESLFYGSLINLFSALDESELAQINEFSNKKENTEEFRALLFEVLNDTPEPDVRTDDKMFELVTNEAASIINNHFNGDFKLIGVLDNVFLY